MLIGHSLWACCCIKAVVVHAGANQYTCPRYCTEACFKAIGDITTTVNKGRQAGSIRSLCIWDVYGLNLVFMFHSFLPACFRKLEVDTMRAILKKELNQVIVEPRSPTALLSGSDVLFTGREFFVGLSAHTNTEGAVAVASTWPEYPCTPIKVQQQWWDSELCSFNSNFALLRTYEAR